MGDRRKRWAAAEGQRNNALKQAGQLAGAIRQMTTPLISANAPICGARLGDQDP